MKIQALPAAKQLPQDRDVYYFNLREIPPKSNKPNSLQIALQTRIVVLSPRGDSAGAQRCAMAEQLTLTRQGDKYIVNNPTPYYVTIIDAAGQKA